MSGGTFGTNWLDLSSTSNRYTRTYVQGFMDISGGNLIVRNNNLFLTQGDASINGNIYLANRMGLGVSGSFGVYDVCNNTQMVLDVSGGVNLRGPVMGGLTLPDNSVMMTATPPLDLSNNFGTVWNQTTSDATRQWISISQSANGQYQTAVVYGGYLYTSNNYGATWSQNASISTTQTWKSVSVSANGQYQTAVNYGATGTVNNIYRSKDYGVTWSSSIISYNTTSVSISATGQYQTFCSLGLRIYTSNDYGATWTLSSGVTNFWSSVSISATGQYQTAVANNASTGYIYTSNNYGLTWTQDTSVGSAKLWSSVSISATGQYQTAVISSGLIYTSNNYGVTWNSTATSQSWTSVNISKNGQYQLACVNNGYIYTSNDYGITWTPYTLTGNKPWGAVSISANGQYISAVVNNGYIYKSITPYNDLVVQNSLISYCDASLNNRLYVGGDASFNGNVYMDDDLTIRGNLNVKQYRTNLMVYTVSYEFIVAEDMSLNGRLYLYDDLSANKRLFLGGDASFGGKVFVSGDVSMNGYLYANYPTSSIPSNAIKGGVTTDLYNIDISTNSRLYVNGDVSMNKRLFVGGQVSAASFSATSDYRIKTDVKTLNNSYNVNLLKPVIYNNEKLNKQDIGFIAHEVQEQYPFLVDGEKDGDKLQTLNYIGLIGILTKEIQELKKENIEIKSRLDNIESKL